VALWYNQRMLPDGSKVCAASASGASVADVVVAGDGTLSLTNVTDITGFPGATLQAAWYSSTQVALMTTAGMWLVSAPWNAPALASPLGPQGVWMAAGGGVWAAQLQNANILVSDGRLIISAYLPDVDTTGRLLYLQPNTTGGIAYVVLDAGSGPALLDGYLVVSNPRLVTGGAVWIRFTNSQGATFGTKTGGGQQPLSASTAFESLSLPIMKGSAVWVLSQYQQYGGLILRPWPPQVIQASQLVVAASELGSIAGAWDGTRFRIAWVDNAGHFHGIAVAPAFDDSGVPISGGGSGGAGGGSSGGGSGSGSGGGGVITQVAGAQRFVRVSAPILPHISAIPPGPGRQAVKVLYDRMNEQDEAKSRQITALTKSLTEANTQISQLTSVQEVLSRGVDDYYAGVRPVPESQFETNIAPPPPHEPPGGGGGGGGGGEPPIPPPDDQGVYVSQMAEQYPDEFLAAAPLPGPPPPNDTWLRRTLQNLRSHDTRWGRNINPSGLLSYDKLAYYYGDDSTPREGSTDTYTYDLITYGSPNIQRYNLVATGVARWTSNGEF